ncbi:hypothetical protein CYCD_11580 [Tenuifilaceae bacterium CYCD]|nr:hypothetical protein CYCD_11580 [Tenuifilaceae bacterium CYCD]
MNPYQECIESFFLRIIELRHTAYHINGLLNNSINSIENYQSDFISGSALVISDWTGPSDNGWEINYHTGFRKIYLKETYSNEISRVISQECCFAFSQAFEALEKFFKDCAYIRIQTIKNQNDTRIPLNILNLSREEMLSGDKLFELIKKCIGNEFNIASGKNNKNLRFKEFWTVLSECRHAIVHSNSYIKLKKVSKTDYHLGVFEYFFDHKIELNEKVMIELNYRKLDELFKKMSEYAFQIFKLLSLKESIDWNILK